MATEPEKPLAVFAGGLRPKSPPLPKTGRSMPLAALEQPGPPTADGRTSHVPGVDSGREGNCGISPMAFAVALEDSDTGTAGPEPLSLELVAVVVLGPNKLLVGCAVAELGLIGLVGFAVAVVIWGVADALLEVLKLAPNKLLAGCTVAELGLEDLAGVTVAAVIWGVADAPVVVLKLAPNKLLAGCAVATVLRGAIDELLAVAVLGPNKLLGGCAVVTVFRGAIDELLAVAGLSPNKGLTGCAVEVVMWGVIDERVAGCKVATVV